MNFPTWTTCANKWCVTRKLRQRQNQPSRSHLLSLWRDDWELSWQFYKNEEVVARYFKNGVNSRSGHVPIFEDEVPSNLVLYASFTYTGKNLFTYVPTPESDSCEENQKRWYF